jgi:hypothetical protein
MFYIMIEKQADNAKTYRFAVTVQAIVIDGHLADILISVATLSNGPIAL